MESLIDGFLLTFQNNSNEFLAIFFRHGQGTFATKVPSGFPSEKKGVENVRIRVEKKRPPQSKNLCMNLKKGGRLLLATQSVTSTIKY